MFSSITENNDRDTARSILPFGPFPRSSDPSFPLLSLSPSLTWTPNCASYLVARGLFSYPPTIMTLFHTAGLILFYVCAAPSLFSELSNQSVRFFQQPGFRLMPWMVLNLTCSVTLNSCGGGTIRIPGLNKSANATQNTLKQKTNPSIICHHFSETGLRGAGADPS